MTCHQFLDIITSNVNCSCNNGHLGHITGVKIRLHDDDAIELLINLPQSLIILSFELPLTLSFPGALISSKRFCSS